MKRLYLANAYGFSIQQSRGPLIELIKALSALGAVVVEPFASTVARHSNDVAQGNLRSIRKCDGIFAVLNGCPPDEGVAFELGYAVAFKKRVFLFRDDFRECKDNPNYPLNLMLFAGLPRLGWDLCYYTSVSNIANPNKALVPWLKEPAHDL